MDPEYLVGGLIEGALGGRRGRRHAMRRLTGGTGSLLNASNLLAAAGLVWGLYEAAQGWLAVAHDDGVARDAAGTSP